EKQMEQRERGAFGGGAPAASRALLADGQQNSFREGQNGAKADADRKGGEEPSNTGPEPTIRKNFADTAFWIASLTSNKDGLAEVVVDMPDQLTAWKIKVWTLGHGTKVGQGETEVVTKRDLIVRLQAPRFFVQKD